jgi:phosphatidylglycerophosphatase A
MPEPSRLARISCTGITSLGVGLLPGPQGTYGSALTLAVALAWLWSGGAALEGWWFLIALAALCALAVASSHAAERLAVFGQGSDPGQIVIDEAVGMLIAFWGQGAPISWWQIGLAFAAFRFFDIVKPWPVNAAQRLPGGWGVVADDVLAGIYALLLVWIARLLAGA